MSLHSTSSIEAILRLQREAYLAGRSPGVEELLRDWPQPQAPQVIIALIQSELDLRLACGLGEDILAPARRYQAAFPQLHSEIAAAVDNALHRTALLSLVPRSSPAPFNAPQSPASPAPESGPAELPRVAGYEVEAEIGRGAMGVVYRARSLGLGRIVALKMLMVGLRPGESDRRRFATEAQAIARLQHPGTVHIYEVGEHDDRPFLALEYCGGGTLEGRLADGLLAATDAAELVRGLARAAHAAHEANVIHRDLKPANILFTEGGEAKVADFGLAKLLDQHGPTHTGNVIGTPSYMPPEQAEAKAGIGPAADVYALGAILYECLTGRPPFRGATHLETLHQVVHEETVSLRHLNRKAPVDLETIAHKCLRKSPEKRYATAEALADDLDRFLRGQPVRARRTTVLERLGRWCYRNPSVASVAALAALLAVAVVAVSVSYALTVAVKNEEITRANFQITRTNAELVRQRDYALRLGDQVKKAAEGQLRQLPGGEEVRLRLLQISLEHYGEMHQRWPIPDLKARLGRAYSGLATLYDEWGQNHRAQADEAYQRAQALLEEVRGLSPEVRLDLARLYLQRGAHLMDTWDAPGAVRALRLGNDLANELADAPGAEVEPRLVRVQLARLLGVTLRHYPRHGLHRARFLEREQEGIALLQFAAAEGEKLLEASQGQPEEVGVARELAVALGDLAYARRKHGDLGPAKVHATRALELGRYVVDATRGDRIARARLVRFLHALAEVLIDCGECDAARTHLDEHQKVITELVTAFPRTRPHRVLWSEQHQARARCHLGCPSHDEARREAVKAVSILQAELRNCPHDASLCHDIAWSVLALPGCSAEVGDALPMARTAAMARPEHWAHRTYGVGLYYVGEYKAAVAELQRAADDQPFPDGETLFYLAMAQARAGRHREARATFAQARVVQERTPNRYELLLLREKARVILMTHP